MTHHHTPITHHLIAMAPHWSGVAAGQAFMSADCSVTNGGKLGTGTSGRRMVAWESRVIAGQWYARQLYRLNIQPKNISYYERSID